MKTDIELKELLEQAVNEKNAVDRIYELNYSEKLRMFDLIMEKK